MIIKYQLYKYETAYFISFGRCR